MVGGCVSGSFAAFSLLWQGRQQGAICETPDTTTLLVGLRDRALLATLTCSGLRASDLATLTYGQINPSSQWRTSR